MSHLENYLKLLAKASKIKLVEEHKFHPTRRWRFDFADLENKIAIECEGGIWTSGRHTRGSGYSNDTEKYNQAIRLGWKVLRYCSDIQIREQFIADYEALTK